MEITYKLKISGKNTTEVLSKAARDLYRRELKYFAREARLISGSPMKKHMRVAVKSYAEYCTRKIFPWFRREAA